MRFYKYKFNRNIKMDLNQEHVTSLFNVAGNTYSNEVTV